MVLQMLTTYARVDEKGEGSVRQQQRASVQTYGPKRTVSVSESACMSEVSEGACVCVREFGAKQELRLEKKHCKGHPPRQPMEGCAIQR
jgi:hypothetical protein